MASTTLKGALLVLKGHAEASGKFHGGAGIGELTSAPTSFLTCSIFMESMSVPEVTLSSLTTRRTVLVRVYDDAFREPREDIEVNVDDAVSDMIERIAGDFTLGGNVRAIAPTEITVQYGYQTIDQKVCRLADISLPMDLNDSGTLAP